jgi:hypothetical protein
VNDDTTKAIVYLVLGVFAVAAVLAAGIVILPILGIIGIGWAIYKFANRPAAKPNLNLLYEAALVQLKDVPDSTTYMRALVGKIIDRWEPHKPALDIADWLAEAMIEIYEAERLNHLDPPPQYHNELEDAQYRETVRNHLKKVQHLPDLEAAMINSCDTFAAALPPIARRQKDLGHLATVSLDTVVQPAVITDLVRHYYSQPLMESGLCQTLRDALDKNIHDLSHIPFHPDTRNLGDLVMPAQFKGSTTEAVTAYLSGTPFEQVFQAQVPFSLPQETRFSGHWIIAPPGRGKTTLLHRMIDDDLDKDAALVVMDSKGDLIDPIKRLKRIADRIVLIEPDFDHPIALNPLDIPKTSVNHAVSLLEYVFSSLLEAKMTALQMTLFRSLLPALVTRIPNPTMETFRDLITNGVGAYREHLEKLPPSDRQFFFDKNNGFESKTYQETRNQLVWRLQFLMSNPIMKTMFSASKTKLDIGKEMDAGKVILINNSKSVLGDEGAEFFGRFFIALILAAAEQRAGRAASEKLPCYFYVDECQTVIKRDPKITTILDECRSQKIALILAHQRTEQIKDPDVLSALANCAIRFANSDDEARYLHDKLRTTTDFLRSLQRGQFAAFVRDLTPTAVALNVSAVDFEQYDRLGDMEYTALRQRMWAQYGLSPASMEPAPPPPSTAPQSPPPTAPASPPPAPGPATSTDSSPSDAPAPWG